MPALKEYRVFISHCWTHDEYYERVRDMLKDAKYFRWLNKSIPQDMPIETISDQRLEREISERISDSDVVIMFDHPAASRRRWIDRELNVARYWSVPIVAVRPYDLERGSQLVNERAFCMAAWRTDSIVKAIRSAVQDSAE